jgi:hypothetical protein
MKIIVVQACADQVLAENAVADSDEYPVRRVSGQGYIFMARTRKS